ncbi:GNAT family N-acetyltransferase [Alsobacter sp. R-9]
MTTFGNLASDDLPAVIDLWVESWTGVVPGIDFPARREWFRGHVGGWMAAGGLARVARDDEGALAGFILIDPRSGLLDQICVAAARKGEGTALLLLGEARRLSPGGIDLRVNVHNARAVRFYEREGFVREGEGVSPNSGLPIYHYRWRP